MRCVAYSSVVPLYLHRWRLIFGSACVFLTFVVSCICASVWNSLFIKSIFRREFSRFLSCVHYVIIKVFSEQSVL